MNLAHWLERRARLSPDRPALFSGCEYVASYGTFWARARSVAGWLTMRGVVPGDRVAIFMKNAPEYLIAFYGIWCAGAVVVPINAKLHGREARFILQDAGVVHVFASADLADALRDADAEVSVTEVPGDGFQRAARHEPLQQIVPRLPEDIAWLFYTSGTT